MWLVTTSLAVGAGLFLADVSLAPKAPPEPAGQSQTDNQEPNPPEPEPDPEPEPAEEPENPVASEQPNPPEAEPENPPVNGNQQPPQTSEPEKPPELIQPPVEITDVDLKPIEVIETEEIQPEPEPEPEPNPQPPVAPKPGGSIADQINLSATARTEYWDHVNPQIIPAEEVRKNCKQVEHIVHGCYLRRGRLERIYIIDTTCQGLTESTAVHELLHAVYSHIDRDDREELDQLLLDFYSQNQSWLDNLLAPYDNLSDEARVSELHSFIGQSASNLPTKLRQHYDRYFSDSRAAAIDYHNQHQSLLDSRRQDIKSLAQQIDDLQDQVDQTRQELESIEDQVNDRTWFETQEKLLEELRAELADPDINSQYNQLVDEYNQRVREHRQLVERYNQIVNEHNRLVGETRQKVSQHNQVVEEINRINRGDCQSI